MSVKRNIIANYLGNAWSALMGFVFIPLYIQYLGMEAIGLIGVFAALQAWFALLDMGLSPTLNREMARFKAGSSTVQDIHDLLRSMETVYVIVALLLCLGIVGGASWIANSWLKVQHLSPAVVTQAIAIMGVMIAFRWMTTLYRSAIYGLQEQVWSSVANASFSTLRNGGVILVIAFVSPTIQAFFIFQGMALLAEMLVLAMKTRRCLPVPERSPRFSLSALQGVWRFAAGMMLIALQSTLLTQVDKLLLSTLLPLGQYGYFILATTMAGVLFLLVGPISNVAFPRFSELVVSADEQAIASQYHKFSQILAVAIIPAGLVLMFFAHSVMLVWTGSVESATAVAPVLSVLAIGSVVNGLIHTPYMLQLAHGWSKLTVITNGIALFFVVPALFLLVPRFGVMAAAWIWVGINLASLLLNVSLMHRRILVAEKWRWFWRDNLLPLLAGLALALVCLQLKAVLAVEGRFHELAFLLVAGTLILAATALATPLGRDVAGSGIRFLARKAV